MKVNPEGCYEVNCVSIFFYKSWRSDLQQMGSYKDEWVGLLISIYFQDVTNFPSGIKIYY